ncbi:MAG: hypothetical protein JW839_18380 [Candidatus Lokiarchaeota archaeon]|nr:hypothetical protein [Candidatus Lokiarchaeota archaeon]
MSGIASRSATNVDYELPDDGMKFIKRAGVSKKIVEEFIIGCLSQLESDKRQIAKVDIGHYKDIEENGLEYLRIVFIIAGKDRQDVIRYENDFFSNHYDVILNQAISLNAKAKKEQIHAFNHHVMVWFDWSR